MRNHVNLTANPLFILNCFSLAAFKILCFGFQQFDYNVCWCGSLCIYSASIKLLGCVDSHLSTNLESFQPLFFSNILSALFFLSSSGIPIISVFLMEYHWSFQLCSFFFLLLRFDNCNCSIFKFVILLPAQIWYWTSLVSFSFQLLYFFVLLLYSYRISIWFHFISFIPLWICSIYSSVVLLVSSNYLSMVSLSSLRLFKTVDLKFCLVSPKSLLDFLRDGFCQFLFCLWMGHSFLFLCMSYNFCWKLGIFNIIIW